MGGLAQVATSGDLLGGGKVDKSEATKVTKRPMKRCLIKGVENITDYSHGVFTLCADVYITTRA